METPAPAEEARAHLVADALEADALEADVPSSADSESEAVADADTVRPRAAAAWAAGLWPSGGAPPSEAELVALYARARAASPAGLSIGEVHAALVLEPALHHLTLADVKKANSKALKGGLLWDTLRGGYQQRAPSGRPDFGGGAPFPLPGGWGGDGTEGGVSGGGEWGGCAAGFRAGICAGDSRVVQERAGLAGGRHRVCRKTGGGVDSLGAGTAAINLRNLTGGTLSEAVVINFAIIHNR
jgi:hypothetical protein